MDYQPTPAENALRTGFKYLNRFMLLQWRLGLGTWMNMSPKLLGRYMVLIHLGRKSGTRRTTPLNYARVHDTIYCVAGFGSIADWYKNIQHNPNVEIWLPDGWWAGIAEDVSHEPDRLQLLREVLIGSGFVAPLMGVNPATLADHELAKQTENYRLVRIRRTEARTGPAGPGDLAWIWPVATHLLLALLVWQRKAVKK